MVNRRISDDIKLAAMRLYEQDILGIEDILEVIGFSRATFFRVLKLWREGGSVAKPKSFRRGRPRKMLREDLEYLNVLLHHRPQFFLSELQGLLKRNRLLSVHFSTIHREIVRAGISTKLLKKIAAERSPIIRSHFKLRMGHYDAEQLIALDETHCDEKTVARRRGRSLSGTRAISSEVFIRGRRYSLLPALTTQGIIAATVVEGSVTRRLYLKFLREQVVSTSVQQVSSAH